MTMPNLTRLIARGHMPFGPRDPNISRVHVASEDTYACENYINTLKQTGLIDPTRVDVQTLPTITGHSALKNVLQRLVDFRKESAPLLSFDEYWAVFDVDNQSPEILNEQTRIAKERGDRLAGSNPCFELWSLLHLTDDIGNLERGQDHRRAPRKCKDRLHNILQAGNPQARGYNSADPHSERFVSESQVDLACQRASKLCSDENPELWPTNIGTHMHRLIERLPRPRQTV